MSTHGHALSRGHILCFAVILKSTLGHTLSRGHILCFAVSNVNLNPVNLWIKPNKGEYILWS